MINSRVIETKNIDWQSLQFIQDDNFKEWVSEGDAKLMQSIVKYQFVDPFKVWNDGTTLYCLDGKHRWLDLKKAKQKWLNQPQLLAEDKKRIRIEGLKRLKRSLKAEYKGTPEGIRAILQIEQQIINLENGPLVKFKRTTKSGSF